MRLRSTQGWDVPMPGVVPQFSRTAGAIRHPGRPLGADTRDVLREVAGLDEQALLELDEAGLIG